MTVIEKRITDFTKNPENVTHAYAMLKVGLESGDTPEVVMQKMLTDLLFLFHGIPYRPNA